MDSFSSLLAATISLQDWMTSLNCVLETIGQLCKWKDRIASRTWLISLFFTLLPNWFLQMNCFQCMMIVGIRRILHTSSCNFDGEKEVEWRDSVWTYQRWLIVEMCYNTAPIKRYLSCKILSHLSFISPYSCSMKLFSCRTML